MIAVVKGEGAMNQGPVVPYIKKGDGVVNRQTDNFNCISTQQITGSNERHIFPRGDCVHEGNLLILGKTDRLDFLSDVLHSH